MHKKGHSNRRISARLNPVIIWAYYVFECKKEHSKLNRVLAYSMLDPYIGVLRLRPGHRVPGSGTLNPKPGKGFGLRGFRVYGLEMWFCIFNRQHN